MSIRIPDNVEGATEQQRQNKIKNRLQKISPIYGFFFFFKSHLTHVSRHTMILGERLNIMSRKSLTIDRFMRFPGSTDGEHDSAVDGEKHTLFTHLKFLYITHKRSIQF